MIKGVTCHEGVKDSPDSRNYALNYRKKTKKKVTWKLTGVACMHTLHVCVCVLYVHVCAYVHMCILGMRLRDVKNNKGIKINKNIKDNEISSIRKKFIFYTKSIKEFQMGH